MSPYSLVNLCSKNLKIIENVLNTPWPRQPMRIWPDPPQTTLKANQILNFTTNLSINRNNHDAGKLLFTHTPGSMNSFRPNYFLLHGNLWFTTCDTRERQRHAHDAIFTGQDSEFFQNEPLVMARLKKISKSTLCDLYSFTEREKSGYRLQNEIVEHIKTAHSGAL